MFIKTYLDGREGESVEISQEEKKKIENLFGKEVNIIQVYFNTNMGKTFFYVNEIRLLDDSKLKLVIEKYVTERLK